MVEKEFPATLDQLDNVTAFAEEELEKLGCPMKTTMQFDVALEEIFVNIAHYAYPDQQGTMQLGIRKNDGNSVSLIFTDSGVRFNPLAKEDPDVSLNAEDRAIGGLGIFMVKKTMTNVEYKYEQGKNILTITKEF